MADTVEKQAVNGASAEGRMAAMRGETAESCPYGDFGGILTEQRKAWLTAWKGANDGR